MISYSISTMWSMLNFHKENYGSKGYKITAASCGVLTQTGIKTTPKKISQTFFYLIRIINPFRTEP